MTGVGDILMSLMDGVREHAGLPELLCRDACDKLGVDGAGVALMDSAGTIERVVGSDERTIELETLQLSLGEGPCVEAFGSGRLVMLGDLAGEGAHRFPIYTPAAREMGIAAMFSYPLHIGAIRLGVLDLFSERAGLLPDETFALALDYVDVAILILLHLQSLDAAAHYRGNGADHDGSSQHAFDVAFISHPEVHQATGMVSVQAAVGLREALLMLRARAFASGRHLHEVARDVVDRKVTFP